MDRIEALETKLAMMGGIGKVLEETKAERDDLRAKLDWSTACLKAAMESQERLAGEIKELRAKLEAAESNLGVIRVGFESVEKHRDEFVARFEAVAKERDEWRARAQEHARFAIQEIRRVENEEREACAKECAAYAAQVDSFRLVGQWAGALACATRIRARGKTSVASKDPACEVQAPPPGGGSEEPGTISSPVGAVEADRNRGSKREKGPTNPLASRVDVGNPMAGDCDSRHDKPGETGTISETQQQAEAPGGASHQDPVDSREPAGSEPSAPSGAPEDGTPSGFKIGDRVRWRERPHRDGVIVAQYDAGGILTSQVEFRDPDFRNADPFRSWFRDDSGLLPATDEDSKDHDFVDLLNRERSEAEKSGYLRGLREASVVVVNTSDNNAIQSMIWKAERGE